MGKVYYDQDGHIEAIQDKVIAIIGYGNPGPFSGSEHERFRR